MIKHIHQHLISELQQNAKTDIIFILSSILLNLIILAVNSGMSENSSEDGTLLFVMIIFASLVVVINLVAVFGLVKGKETRKKLLEGVMKMYEDKNVIKYYDHTLLKNYSLRYSLFILVVVCTGVIAIVVPFIMR